jgi:hypothetical protein
MDAKRFEVLSRRVGEAASRRAAVAALATALAAPVLGRMGVDEAAAGLPIVNCKAPGKKCKKNQQCCSQRCKKGKGRCLCNKKGRPCWKPLEGAECCSQKCNNGKCS